MTIPLPAVVVKGGNDGGGGVGTPLSPRGRPSCSDGNDANQQRKTNIQVCVRLRPLLPTDQRQPTARPPTSSTSSLSSSASARPSRLPTPTKKGKSGTASGIPRKNSAASSSAHFARKTQSSQRRLDADHDNNDNDQTIEPNSTLTTTTGTLIPAWEVAPSSLHDNETDDTIYQSPSTNPDPARKSSYAFDRVFGPQTQTTRLYDATVSDVVRASMEGYHGSVFAYGVTSSGKTYTMTGTPAEPGIIPLAVRDCFRYIRGEEDTSADDHTNSNSNNNNREYLLRVSYMEIYNEQIHDLLAPPPVPGPRGAGSSGGGVGGSTIGISGAPGTSSSIRIFESKTEGVVIRGLKEEIVTCPEQVFGLLATGEARRRTGSTALNRASSRSHSIFRLIVESRARRGPRRGSGMSTGSVAGGMDSPAKSVRSAAAADDDSVGTGTSISTAGGGPVRVSSLSLVDLAGSESVKATGSTGARQKEGQYINKSLMTLGHVIYKLSELSAKAEKGGRSDGVSASMQMSTKHIPYRDSKLTRLLQPSLSGNAQICIVCNISPLTRNLEESHNTLKFATRAKKIKQSASINEVVDDRTLLQNYREEIEALKAQLREAKVTQDALQKEKEAAATQVPLDENDEDIVTLVSAIQNLEKLILRKTSIKSDGAGSRPQQNDGSKSRGQDKTGSFFASGNFEALLAGDDDADNDNDNEVAETETSTACRDLNKSAFVGNIDDEDANTNGNASAEDDGLITELHRIQGLLGSVLKKGRSGTALPDVLSPVVENSSVSTPSRPTHSNAGGASAVYNTPNRDEEVEQLHSQLRDMEVATSLRKADSSFLQSQLQEKDNLLKEVSKILDAVEKRQVELEEDNAQMKKELTKKTLLLGSQSREIERLKASRQDDDDGLFDDLVG